MKNTNIDVRILSALLAQFSDKKMELTDDVLVKIERYLFHNEQFQELAHYPELQETLFYLKDVMVRNFIKDINGLIQYYEKMQRGIDVMFDRYEQARCEEKLAARFQATYETFVKINVIDQHQKSESLYYPISHAHYLVGYENISYRNSIEEEILHLSMIKGNQLVKQKNASRIFSEKNKEITSN